MALSCHVADWQVILQEEWRKEEKIQQMIQELTTYPTSHSKFSWADNQLGYKGRLWIGGIFCSQVEDITRSSW